MSLHQFEHLGALSSSFVCSFRNCTFWFGRCRIGNKPYWARLAIRPVSFSCRLSCFYHLRSPSSQALVPQGFQFRKKFPHFPGSFLTFLWLGFFYTSFVCAALVDLASTSFVFASQLLVKLVLWESHINLIDSSCTSLVFASLCRSRINFIRLRFSIACRTCLMRNPYN